MSNLALEIRISNMATPYFGLPESLSKPPCDANHCQGQEKLNYHIYNNNLDVSCGDFDRIFSMFNGRYSMLCQVCEHPTKVTSVVNMGSARTRYRVCTNCCTKWRSFEQWEERVTVRSRREVQFAKWGEHSKIAFNCCGSDKLRHTRRSETKDCITHVFECTDCKGLLGFHTDQSDPIGKALKTTAENARVI